MGCVFATGTNWLLAGRASSKLMEPIYCSCEQKLVVVCSVCLVCFKPSFSCSRSRWVVRFVFLLLVGRLANESEPAIATRSGQIRATAAAAAAAAMVEAKLRTQRSGKKRMPPTFFCPFLSCSLSVVPLAGQQRARADSPRPRQEEKEEEEPLRQRPARRHYSGSGLSLEVASRLELPTNRQTDGAKKGEEEGDDGEKEEEEEGEEAWTASL